MGKKDTITEIAHLHRRLGQALVPLALDAWQELVVPLAQLKSLVIIIAKGETNFSTLARYLGVTRGNVTGIIDRLVEQGLVSRRPSPDDRRSIRLRVTDKGQDLVMNLMESQTGQMVQILEYMSPAELQHLFKGLSGFIHAVDSYQKATK